MSAPDRATPERIESVEASRAPKAYWDSIWSGQRLPRALDPHDRSLFNHPTLKFDAFLRRCLPRDCSGFELVELGCARSLWLPYFAREFGLQVTGVDYSRRGCEQALALLDREQVKGDVVCADIFSPPPTLLNRFDYVVSFGLVEHFPDTSECIRRCAKFLKPGGTMITVIPNLNGLVGWLQKTLGRDVYDLHIPLDAGELASAHQSAGLTLSSCEYLDVVNFGVLNLTVIRRSFFGLQLTRLLNATSVLAWSLERIGIRFPANRTTSPYVACVAAKSAGMVGDFEATRSSEVRTSPAQRSSQSLGADRTQGNC